MPLLRHKGIASQGPLSYVAPPITRRDPLLVSQSLFVTQSVDQGINFPLAYMLIRVLQTLKFKIFEVFLEW